MIKHYVRPLNKLGNRVYSDLLTFEQYITQAHYVLKYIRVINLNLNLKAHHLSVTGHPVTVNVGGLMPIPIPPALNIPTPKPISVRPRRVIKSNVRDPSQDFYDTMDHAEYDQINGASYISFPWTAVALKTSPTHVAAYSPYYIRKYPPSCSHFYLCFDSDDDDRFNYYLAYGSLCPTFSFLP